MKSVAVMIAIFSKRFIDSPKKNQRTDMKTIAGASLQVIDFPGCGEPPLSGGVKEVTRQVFHLVAAIDIRTTVVTSQRFIGRHPAP
ncbi:hypothetical protein QW29_22695 [Salmonella enterica]|nr:hypothetical protein [Salmonella enterica]EAQ6002721.1 hypothetical protein [Salmonella enterica]EAR3680639.1 hypothetical protein [Salmonella enterica]EAS1770428.1 hypothetical protein [Salmonella enterica]